VKIKESKYFELHEILPPELYYYLKENNILWKGWLFFPYTTIETIDTIRETFGTTIINTYAFSKAFQEKWKTRTESGIRIRNWEERPGYVSAHYHGLATDSLNPKYSAQEIREHILKNPEKFPHITRLECTIKGKEISWLHWDSVPVEDRIVQLHL
jgi:hypothetical protein